MPHSPFLPLYSSLDASYSCACVSFTAAIFIGCCAFSSQAVEGVPRGGVEHWSRAEDLRALSGDNWRGGYDPQPVVAEPTDAQLKAQKAGKQKARATDRKGGATSPPPGDLRDASSATLAPCQASEYEGHTIAQLKELLRERQA